MDHDYEELLGRIRNADSMDDFHALDLEILEIQNAEVRHKLTRALERKSCGLVHNSAVRAMNQIPIDQDQDELGDDEFLEYGAAMVEDETLERLSPEAARVHSLVQFSRHMDSQPDMFSRFRRRMMERGGDGVTFRFSDLASDPEMSLIMREVEDLRDYLRGVGTKYARLLEDTDGLDQVVREVIDLVEGGTRPDEVQSRILWVREREGLSAKDKDALDCIDSYCRSIPAMESYSRNVDVALSFQDLEDQIGTKELMTVARNPNSPEAMEILRGIGEPDPPSPAL